MRIRKNLHLCLLAVSAVVVPLAASAPLVLVDSPAVAAEQSPPGDIPDNQVFVSFVSPLGFELQIPEGWARTETADSVLFSDKYNAIGVFTSKAQAAPVANQSDAAVGAFVAAGRSVKVTAVKAVVLPGGHAVKITFTANSAPNEVTGRSIRVEGVRYLFFRDGALAALDMEAPAGADNVDAWNLVAASFRWR